MRKSTKHIVNFCLMVSALLSSPLIAKADLVFNSGGSYVTSINVSESHTTVFDQPSVYHAGFAEMGSLDGTYSHLTYSLMQSGGVAHMDWSGFTSIPERDLVDFSRVVGNLVGYTYFTPTVNHTYSLSSSFLDSGTTGFSGGAIILSDNTDNVDLFFKDERRDPYGSYSTIVGNASGTLIAGHQYRFQGVIYLHNLNYYNQWPEVNNPGSGSAEWHLITAPVSSVPEPSSLALAGLGGIGLIVRAIRRRCATV